MYCRTKRAFILTFCVLFLKSLFGTSEKSAVNFVLDYNFKKKIRTILKSNFKGEIRRKTTTLVSIRLAFLGGEKHAATGPEERGEDIGLAEANASVDEIGR